MQVPVEMKALIIKLRFEGKSLREIGKIFNRNHSTIQTVLRNFLQTGSLLNRPRAGRPKKLQDATKMSDSEDLRIEESPPSSPQHQSDSDGSVSSGESIPHGQGPPVKCMWENCGYWFSQLEVLAAHVAHVHAVAGKGGLFYCGWEGCSRGDRGFNARYKMLVHVRTHTNERPHLCFKCNKTFSRAENLKIHSRTHTGEKPYVCTVAGCGKAYSNSSDRFKHMRTHSVGKPYVCKVPGCPKKYTDPSSLRKHLKTYRHVQPAIVEPVATPTSVIAPTPLIASSVINSTHTKIEYCNMDVERDEKPAIITSFSPKAQDPLQETRLSYSPLSAPAFPAWPSFIHWWTINDTPPHTPITFVTEQDTPLDLTCPIKLHNKV